MSARRLRREIDSLFARFWRDRFSRRGRSFTAESFTKIASPTIAITILSFAIVFIFLFEWVFHGVLLKETYAQTSSLWRPEAEMQGLFAWMLVGQATIALMFVILFARGFGGRVCRPGRQVDAAGDHEAQRPE